MAADSRCKSLSQALSEHIFLWLEHHIANETCVTSSNDFWSESGSEIAG